MGPGAGTSQREKTDRGRYSLEIDLAFRRTRNVLRFPEPKRLGKSGRSHPRWHNRSRRNIHWRRLSGKRCIQAGEKGHSLICLAAGSSRGGTPGR